MAEPSIGQGGFAPLRYPVDHIIHLAREQVDMGLSKFQLRYILEDYVAGQKKPSWKNAVPWFIGFFSIVFTLVPADFQTWAGVPGWLWSQIGVALAMILAAVGLYELWRWNDGRKIPVETAKACVDRIAQEQEAEWRATISDNVELGIPNQPLPGAGHAQPPTSQ